MIRTTKEWEDIEIDTYNNERHIRNICKQLNIFWYNLITLQECRDKINKYISLREYYADEIFW